MRLRQTFSVGVRLVVLHSFFARGGGARECDASVQDVPVVFNVGPLAVDGSTRSSTTGTVVVGVDV